MAESQVDLEQQCVTAFKQGNHDQAVQLLPQLQQPGDVTTEFEFNGKRLRPNKGVILFHLAAYHGWLDIIKTIQQHISMYDVRDSAGLTPLHYAAAASSENCLEMINYLINTLGCDPNAKTTRRSLPLHISCRHGNLDTAKYFITEQNCNPNVQNSDGWTPLHMASQNGHINIIQYLIVEQNCDPNTSNNYGNLSLHNACANGQLNTVKYFIREQKCDPNCQTKNGHTPLYCASENGHMDIIKYLVTELGCDPTILNNNGLLPLHIASLNGHSNTVKYFIGEQKCDPNSRTDYGSTPLHCASENGHMDIIQYLITELGCDPTISNSNGLLPLHIASLNGHLNAVKYFITEQNSHPNIQGCQGFTPLHCAAQGGHLDIIQYLITELGCEPTISDNNGFLPLHIASLKGHLNTVKYLICEQKCHPNSRSKNGSTPLYCASQNGHMDIIQYLVTELGCDPTIVDFECRTFLHWACYYGLSDMVQWLLHNTQVDLMAKDIYGNTCIDLANDHYKVLKIFQPLVDSSRNFPIHKFGKTVLAGNSAAGKTTLAKVIAKRAAKQSITWLDSKKKIKKAETHTAGIVPSLLESWEVGNMVVFDLAGQAEYHSSHSAVMETVMQQSPATFINLIDLSNTDEEIKRQLLYWVNFIENATCRTAVKSSLIVVGSHADLLSKMELQIKSSLITNMLSRNMRHGDFMELVTMDCRKFDSKSTRKFISLLCRSQLSISSKAPSMNYYCHLLYAFFKSKPEMVHCTLGELILLATHEDCPIPTQSVSLSKFLTTLNDRGMIIFLKNQQKLEESWIIVNIEVLLKDINGKLFSEVKSVITGIICSSTLKKLFPQYNLEMLVGFLQTLELCHCVNLSGIDTNLLQGIEDCSQRNTEKYFFFPSLLNMCRPIILPSDGFSFGWYLSCKPVPEYQFFTSRFLHVLLLRLAYTFPLACGNHDTFHRDQTGCNVWNNGISWENEEGIRTIVELIDNQRVLVLVSHKAASRPVECSKHHSAVIRLILDLQQQFCSNLETSEYLISHSLLRNWTTDIQFPSNKDLFSIENIAKSMLLHKPYILNCNNETCEDFRPQYVLEHEPYYQLSPSSVCELMDNSKVDELVSQTLLHEVQSQCQVHQLEPSQTHTSLRKCVDKFSLFAGRNPIVSSEI